MTALAPDQDSTDRPPRREDPDRAPWEPLWRNLVGDRLRTTRHERGETLTDVADRAGVSPQYLSEVERGRKEPSSEMIAAIGGALDLTLLELTASVAEALDDRRNQQVEHAAAFALAA
ncbi:MAG: helix-turn-helix domain-containing protein, partial [Microbacterium sp.]